MKLTTYSSLLGLLSMASAFPTPQDASRVEAAAAIKVMPFGASIVEGGCWRAYVQKQLRDAGVTNFDMVGGQTGPNECKLNGVVVDFDKNNEGHSGRLAQQYVVNNELPGFLNAANPQIIIMHLGTNDIKADRTTAQIIGDYTTLLNQMRAKNPNVQLLLMTLIPLRASNNEARWVAAVPTLNTAIAAWAFANTKSNSPITLVDPFTGFNADTMTADGTHPNEAGNKLMADRLFAPLRDALKVRS